MSRAREVLPLKLSLKCERVFCTLPHIQDALGQSDGSVVRLVKFIYYEEEV